MRIEDAFDRTVGGKPPKPLQPFYKRFKESDLRWDDNASKDLLVLAFHRAFRGRAACSECVRIDSLRSLCVCDERTWVFEDKSQDVVEVVKECKSFLVGRLGTLVLEELVLRIGIDKLGIDSMAVKVFAQLLVIMGNYVISKWFVFKKDKRVAEK